MATASDNNVNSVGEAQSGGTTQNAGTEQSKTKRKPPPNPQQQMLRLMKRALFVIVCGYFALTLHIAPGYLNRNSVF